MAKITCTVCGEPIEAGQCKCQSFSEIPLPHQRPHSADGAIREGDPPHKHPPPAVGQLGTVIKCALIGLVAGGFGMAVYGGIEYSKETAPIMPTWWVMLMNGLCCGAPIGLFAGIVVGGLISSRKSSGPEGKSTT
jgi:hypothetical protein